jgi:cytochrome P450
MGESRDATSAPPLFSPAFIQNPYPTYRDHLAGPVVQRLAALPGSWAVFHYEAFTTIIRDDRLSSDRSPELFRSYDKDLTEFSDFHRQLARWLLFLDPRRIRSCAES